MTHGVRPATEADVDEICEIGRATWPPTYAFAGQDYVAHGLATWWSADAVERGLVTTTTLVAESDGRVVGMGNVDLRPDVPVIWKLYVHPDYQGQGFGSDLLNGLVASVPAARKTVAIEYIEGNVRAASVYASRGFVEVRRDPADRPHWPKQVWAELSLPGS
jgi:GNAT superfamily N-acetyltransferase